LNRRSWMLRYGTSKFTLGSSPIFQQTSSNSAQPRPEAAIGWIHKQPVRWTHKRVVECDGGGGPLGHPRIFINVDKPQVCMCTYCGLPFVSVPVESSIVNANQTTRPMSTIESIWNLWITHIPLKLGVILQKSPSPRELQMKLLDSDRW
jgi:uncharacterized Zn-finger protein